MSTIVDVLNGAQTALSAVALVENLVVIVVFAGTKQLRINYYGFAFNLALSNLVFSAIAIATLHSSLSNTGLLQACYFVSVLTMLMVAVTRYLALSLMPSARFDALVTTRRLVGVCVLLWCCSLFTGLFPQLLSDDAAYMASKAAIPILILIIWLATAVIYYLVFRKIKQYTPPLASVQGVSASHEQDDTRVRQTRRLLATFTIILLTSFVCWAPFSVMILIRYVNPAFNTRQIRPYFVAARIVYSMFTNLNPLIYWWRLEGFRGGLFAIFCRCFVKQESRDIALGTVHEQTVTDEAV